MTHTCNLFVSVCLFLFQILRYSAVLMGRGKRISEWPGNIYFRQIINKYRDEYNSSSRKNKVVVAKSVLDAIHAIGGRFLQQSRGDKWEEVDLDRAIEKACQALREKEKSRPPEISPFVGKKIIQPPKAPPSVRPASSPRRPGRKSNLVDADNKQNGTRQRSNEHSKPKHGEDDKSTSTEEDDNDGDEVLTSADESGNEEESEDDASSTEDEGEVDDYGMESYGKLPDERAFPLVEAFIEKHGHCAIAPYDCLSAAKTNSEEMALANWCTAQRQLYREIQTKYRKGTKDDTQRIEKLQKLGFCWDYEAWHWERSFDALQQEMEQSSKNQTGLSDEVLGWIQEQRRRGKRALPSSQSMERANKLQAVGVLLL